MICPFSQKTHFPTEITEATVEADDAEETAEEEIREEGEGQNGEEEDEQEESADSEEGEEDEDEVVDGAIGGQDSPSGTFATHIANNHQEAQGVDNQREGLLRELQKEIKKLKLLGVTG